jgi:hypothetical protein
MSALYRVFFAIAAIETWHGGAFGKKLGAASSIPALRPKVIKGRARLARPDNQV